MPRYLKSCLHWLSNLGIDPIKFRFFLKGFIPFLLDRKALKKQLKNRTDFRFGMSYPCLSDRFDSSGVMKGHYFHQDLLIARRIYQANPFEGKFQVNHFSYVDDRGDLHKHIELTGDMIENNGHCTMGCAIFELQKI